MAESLLVGAAVGAAFGELLKTVMETKDKAIMFRPALEYLRKILTAIDPLIGVLEQQNKELGRPKQELESLIQDLKQGTELVNKCSKIRRVNIYRRLQYHEQLIAVAESLERFFKIDMQAQIARDLKETLNKVNRIHSAINKLSFLRTGSKSDSAFEEMKGLSQIEIHDSTETVLDTATHPVVAQQVIEDITSLSQKVSQIEAKAAQDSNYNDPFEPNRKITGFEPYKFQYTDLIDSSSDVLGETKYGTNFKVKLKNGTTILINKLQDVSIGNEEFDERLQIAQKVSQHPNVMALLGWHHPKKLLIYDYMEAGTSLSMLLHGTKEIERVPLDWSSRLKISLEIAKGIAHIHSCGGIVHGNISSSNVLVRVDDFQSSILDFGLASLVSNSKRLSNSKGYVIQAPEVVINGGKLTLESDVYSFGILLLEMLTRKLATYRLRSWVETEAVDGLLGSVLDYELHNNNHALDTMHLAMRCVAMSPYLRPSMYEVVMEIEQIAMSDSSKK